MGAVGVLEPERRAAVERWFVHQGLPHFIAGYNAREDVLTRALPFLSLVFVGEVVLSLRPGWPWWGNLLAFLGGAAVLAAGFALANRVRRQPWWQRPRRVGAGEVAIFALLPPALPVIFGGEVVPALSTVAANLVLLGGAYVVTSFGLLPMLRWSVVRIARELSGILGLVSRALPLLLLFATFLFINAELWQVAAGFTVQTFAATVILLVLVGVAFFLARLPGEVETLRRFDSWTEVGVLLEGSPLQAADIRAAADPPAHRPLSRRDWFNVGMLIVVSQGAVILLAALVIGLFFVAFGVLLVREDTILAWTGVEQVTLLLPRFAVLDTPVLLTVELLRVAGFIAAFSGLQITVSANTDPTYREEFLGRVVSEVRRMFAVRAAYLDLIASSEPAGSASNARRQPLAQNQ